MSQNGNHSQVLVNIKNCLKPPPSIQLYGCFLLNPSLFSKPTLKTTRPDMSPHSCWVSAPPVVFWELRSALRCVDRPRDCQDLIAWVMNLPDKKNPWHPHSGIFFKEGSDWEETAVLFSKFVDSKHSIYSCWSYLGGKTLSLGVLLLRVVDGHLMIKLP